jgi:hypothetical protein
MTRNAFKFLASRADGQPRPGEDQPQPVPGKDIPIREPEPDRLPDEEPNPNPDENREPPMQSGGRLCYG